MSSLHQSRDRVQLHANHCSVAAPSARSLCIPGRHIVPASPAAARPRRPGPTASMACANLCGSRRSQRSHRHASASTQPCPRVSPRSTHKPLCTKISTLKNQKKRPYQRPKYTNTSSVADAATVRFGAAGIAPVGSSPLNVPPGSCCGCCCG
eukprot:260059-Chlamydomonas_euryale.AAC.2